MKSLSKTPAPAKDMIKGSKVNPKGSASSEKTASQIKLDAKTLVALNNKLKEFKQNHPSKKNITLADLKAVYRRGAGAYSTSHRPTISGGKPNSRNAWAMARVNKFLLKAGGTKVKKAYVQDDDLMKYENGGEIDKLIDDGIVELKMYDTTNEHSKIYGFDAEKPLYIQSLVVSKSHRMKGIGSKVMQYITEYATQNGHDVIFGHITQKAEPNIQIIKSMLQKSGFNTIDGNNDFYKLTNVTDINYNLGGGVKTDFNEFENDGLRKALLSFWGDFTNGGISNYLSIGKEDYVLTDHNDMMVILRKGEKFSEIEKNKIEKWIEPYLNKDKKPQIAKYFVGYKIENNRIMININPNESYADGGEVGQDITCKNCGWEWNTLQSEKHDKYVCHNCGFDNTMYYSSDVFGYADGGVVDEHNETYKKWRSLVNMSYGELKKFYESKEGKEAGLSSGEAKKQGIDSGRESARMVMKMKTTPRTKWTPDMWRWAKKQISFISRMSGNQGDLYNEKGNKTRKHTSLLIWGNNPEKKSTMKYENGGLTEKQKKEEFIKKYLHETYGDDFENFKIKQKNSLIKMAGLFYDKEKFKEFPYKKYLVRYKIKAGATRTKEIVARTPNEARKEFRMYADGDKIISITLSPNQTKYENGGEITFYQDFRPRERKFKIGELVFFEADRIQDVEAKVLAKVDEKRVKIEILESYFPSKKVKIAGDEKVDISLRTKVGLGRESLAFEKGKEVKIGTIKVVNQEKINPLKGYTPFNYVPKSKEFKDIMNKKMENGGATNQIRKFFKTGIFKYILINEKRANNFSMWSNKKASLQKFIDDIIDREVASEFKIYETKIEFDGKPINYEDTPIKLNKNYNLPLRNKDGVADKLNSKNYISILILDGDKKMADGGVMDVRMQDTVQRMDDPNFADISMYGKGGKINYSEYYKQGGKTKTCEIFDENGERRIDKESIKKLTTCVNNLPQTKEFHINEKGEYSKERKELHKKIIYDIKKDLVCVENKNPIAILMGGSPASGKSTFLKKYRPYLLKSEILKIDADEVRSKLPEYKGYNATQTHLETKDIVNLLLSDRNIGIPCLFDLIYDGTMNNTKSYLPLIKLLKSLGYKVYVVYVDKVPKKEIVNRALLRYKKSGRFVPLEVIDDFFDKGKTALNEIKQEVDGYMIVDGSNSDYKVEEKGGIQLPKNRRYSNLGKPITITTEDVVREYKKGGELDPDNPSIKNQIVHKSGEVGGMLVGKRHSEGGIKAVNKSTGQPLEMEGGEVVITRNAVSDTKKREFNGKMMTNREILSEINQSGGGVSFADGGKVQDDCGCNHYDVGGKVTMDKRTIMKMKELYPQDFEKGMKEEGSEHSGTFKDLKKGRISIKSALQNVVTEHLKSKPDYYKNYENGGILNFGMKQIPSFKEFLRLSNPVKSPFDGDNGFFYKISNDGFFYKEGNKNSAKISDLFAYQTYLYDNYSVVFSQLPAKIKNAFTLGKQALIDNYINS